MGSERVAGYFQRIARDLGHPVAQDVLRKIGDLNPSQLATLSERGRLDNLAEAIKFDLPEDKLRDYVGWLEASKAGRAPIPRTSTNERAIDELLAAEGKVIEPNLLAQEWVGGRAGRQGDRFVDGVLTEYKALKPGATSGTIKNEVNSSISGRGQAREIVIDSRGSGLTEAEAQRGLDRVGGITRDKLDRLAIILGDGRLLSKIYP